jgi:hypothetical protein
MDIVDRRGIQALVETARELTKQVAEASAKFQSDALAGKLAFAIDALATALEKTLEHVP